MLSTTFQAGYTVAHAAAATLSRPVASKLRPQLFKLLPKLGNDGHVVTNDHVFVVLQYSLPCPVEGSVHQCAGINDAILVVHVGYGTIMPHRNASLHKFLNVTASLGHLQVDENVWKQHDRENTVAPAVPDHRL